MTRSEFTTARRGWGRSRLIRLPLLVRCLGVLSAAPLGQIVWAGFSLKWVGPGARVWSVVDAQAVVVLAAAVYLFYWIRIWPRQSLPWVGSLVAAMAVLASLDRTAGIGLGDDLWVYAAAMAGCGLAPRLGLPVIGLLAVLAVLQPGSPAVVMGGSTVQIQVNGQSSGVIASSVSMAAGVLPIIVIGCAAAVLTHLARTNTELHATQMRLARVAVDEERARLSRDLHDLLGHSLSLMAIKAELATRLVDQPQHPAAGELEDLRLMARAALGDLREVVGGARLPTLAGELDGARIAAEAAAVELVVEDGRSGVLSPEVEAVCAWIVREGVTNVVKHSGARRCRLRMERHDGAVLVMVADDGRGGTGSVWGSGLKGLGERIGALGGRLDVHPHGGSLGGFELAAQVPFGAGEPVP